MWRMWEGSEREWSAFFCSLTQLLRKKIEGCSRGTTDGLGTHTEMTFLGLRI